MIKKILLSTLLISSIVTTQALAKGQNQTPTPPIQQTTPTKSIAVAPKGIGNYNNFGKLVELNWLPTLNAKSYNVYGGIGYTPTSFQLLGNVINGGITYYHKTISFNFVAPRMGWYSVYVTAIDANGLESDKSPIAHINIIR